MSVVDTLMQKALCIEEDISDYDPSLPPSNGHEYLYRVMREAAECPDILVASLDSKKFKSKKDLHCIQIEVLPECKKDLIPSSEWQLEQVSSFSELRKSIEKRKALSPDPVGMKSMPNSSDENGWYKYLFGDGETLRNEPKMKILLSLSQVKLENLLNYFIKWFREGSLDFDRSSLLWVYSMLAYLETPLTPELCSSIRDLSRLCWQRRSKIESKEDSVLTPLNLVICLVGKYFSQLDLSDPITASNEETCT